MSVSAGSDSIMRANLAAARAAWSAWEFVRDRHETPGDEGRAKRHADPVPVPPNADANEGEEECRGAYELPRGPDGEWAETGNHPDRDGSKDRQSDQQQRHGRLDGMWPEEQA